MKLDFVKMEGIGNDYVYIDATKNNLELTEAQIQKLSNRNFGIGSDGVILIKKSNTADFQMDMYNSDGSRSEMCGNGIRCVGKFVYDHGLTKTLTPKIETGAGILTLDMKLNSENQVELVTVDMGEPILDPKKIPTTFTEPTPLLNQVITIDGKDYRFSSVSMGNPHCIIMVENAKEFPVTTVGPKIEHHSYFPKRVNVEFVHKLGKNHLFQRTWERGAGETMACGTGACAVAVASHLNGITDREVTIDLLGGKLFIRWDEKTNHVFMTGPAVETFHGSIVI